MNIDTSENKILRVLRETNGYTQEYVGEVLGIEQNTYSKLERGETQLTVDRIKILSKLYNVNPNYFLTDDMQIINHNIGEGSKSYIKNTFNNEKYFDGNDDSLKLVYDKLLAEKDKQILSFQKELSETKKQLNALIKKLADKL